MAIARRITLLACALLGASCVEYGEAPFACVKSKACPEGYQCVNDVCLRDGTKPPPKPDARVDGPWTPPTPDVGQFDVGKLPPDSYYAGKEPPATFPDLPAGLTCKQIDDCYGTCKTGDKACFQACHDKGSPDGKAKMDALVSCENSAAYGPCDYACTYRSQQACYTCIDQVCAAQLAACFP